MSDQPDKPRIPQLKGVQALIQKTSAEAAETPAQHIPPHAEQEAAPPPKLNYLQPEELERIKPTMTIARMDNGDLRIQLKSPPVPIVMAHQVPNPKGAS